MWLIKRKDFLKLEHEREGRFEDKVRADGKSVFYDCYLRGPGRKLELLEPDREHWDAFWAEIDRLPVDDWEDEPASGEDEGGEEWSLTLRRAGRSSSLWDSGSPPEELLSAVSSLLGRQLASARAALLPEPVDEDEADSADEDKPS